MALGEDLKPDLPRGLRALFVGHEALQIAVLAGVPKVFEWLRWAATLGALRYVALRTHSEVLQWLGIVCTVLLGLYYGVYATTQVENLVGQQFTRKRLLIPVALVGIFAAAVTYCLVIVAADNVVMSQLQPGTSANTK